MRSVFLPLTIAAFLAAGGTAKNETRYLSPDRALNAAVISKINERDPGDVASRIEIRWNKRKLFGGDDFTLPNAEHLFSIVKAEWTADSKFFVYSLASASRRQPWHFETFFYDRNQNQILSLDNLIGPVASSDFKLLPPNTVETILWNGGTPKRVRVPLAKLDEARDSPPKK